MRVVILGSAAGGGVPQWNCGCAVCAAARASGTSRTQSSVAVSADGERWVLLNASPDLRQQLAACRALWPRAPRATPLSAVVLTDAEIDHTLGLLLLREAAQPIPVYAPDGVAMLLARDWPVLRLLARYAGAEGRQLPDAVATTLRDVDGRDLGLRCSAMTIARKAPRYATRAPDATFEVGLRLEDPRTRGVLAYIPSAGAVDATVRSLAAGADLLCYDGTFWSDEELRAAGVEAPTAREMGHLPVGGAGGSLAQLGAVGAKRTVLVHINNTNPILDRASPERAQVERAGIAVAEDGMEFEL
ncbi:MAG TPA: pyrroloquinoline quinone biosynthesis protein PqqB [Gemmatimonadales bacterium]|nr:pyrroloquinoline quinone biosynthesis protein PqqB [Gemmatimonadales bacterium]